MGIDLWYLSDTGTVGRNVVIDFVFYVAQISGWPMISHGYRVKYNASCTMAWMGDDHLGQLGWSSFTLAAHHKPSFLGLSYSLTPHLLRNS